MQKVLTAEEMSEVDRRTTEEYGIPSILLMENAAHATAKVITEEFGGSVKYKSFLVLCGKGNNGGDGAALARLLAVRGGVADVILFGRVDETKGDARTNFEACQKLANFEGEIVNTRHPEVFMDETAYTNSGSIKFYEVGSRKDFDDLLNHEFSQHWDVVIDAVFGTGLARPLEGWLGNVVHHINILNDTQRNGLQSERLLVSVDLPSGLFASSNESPGINFHADLTVTFTAPKLANVLPPASSFNGELHIANIGSPQALIDDSPSQTFLTEKEDVRRWLAQTQFSKDSYKKKRGNVLLVVGSKKYSGAAVLAGNGAMRSGVGLVTVAVPESAVGAVSERVLPEVIVEGVAENEAGSMGVDARRQIEQLSEKADVLAIGSGLSSDEETTRELVKRVVKDRETPVIVDADGLNALSPFELKSSDARSLILTPHEGEFLRLLGTDDKKKIQNRLEAVRNFARTHNVILVLKGERTLIAEPGGKVVINPTGNSGLGKAGNGDNLFGIIAGFVAQGVQAKVDVFEAVVAALYIAGLAGDLAESEFGKRVMLPSDVRDCLSKAFEQIEEVNE